MALARHSAHPARCHNQPKRQDGGAVAADSISPWPKGTAQTQSSLLPPSKNSFHFAIVEVIPELCPMSPVRLNTASETDRCLFEDREHSMEVIYSKIMAPGMRVRHQ